VARRKTKRINSRWQPRYMYVPWIMLRQLSGFIAPQHCPLQHLHPFIYVVPMRNIFFILPRKLLPLIKIFVVCLGQMNRRRRNISRKARGKVYYTVVICSSIKIKLCFSLDREAPALYRLLCLHRQLSWGSFTFCFSAYVFTEGWTNSPSFICQITLHITRTTGETKVIVLPFLCEFLHGGNQGCGSGSGLDPVLMTLWIRIRIGNPEPDPGAKKWRNFSGKMHFLVIL
jgi:hypothetical protein